jgi:hypothetical protein
MYILLYVFLGFITIGNAILLNQKLFNDNYCNGCDKCSLGYTGSGVLLHIAKQHKFILGVDYKNELTDFGGKINFTKEKIWITASRELFEESNRVFNVSYKNIISCNYIDIDRNLHKYRCYILPITKFDKKLFHLNKFNSICKTNSFIEIIDIIEIKEETLKNLLFNKVDSPEIIPYYISPRLKKILYVYFNIQ